MKKIASLFAGALMLSGCVVAPDGSYVAQPTYSYGYVAPPSVVVSPPPIVIGPRYGYGYRSYRPYGYRP